VGALDKRLVKNVRIPWRIIEGETLLIDHHEGELIRLNAVATEIWSAIDGRRTVGEIIHHIQATFEVSQKQATKDVRRFIKQLLHWELVEEPRVA
jgi:hypothetical protein